MEDVKEVVDVEDVEDVVVGASVKETCLVDEVRDCVSDAVEVVD